MLNNFCYYGGLDFFEDHLHLKQSKRPLVWPSYSSSGVLGLVVGPYQAKLHKFIHSIDESAECEVINIYEVRWIKHYTEYWINVAMHIVGCQISYDVVILMLHILLYYWYHLFLIGTFSIFFFLSHLSNKFLLQSQLDLSHCSMICFINFLTFNCLQMS